MISCYLIGKYDVVPLEKFYKKRISDLTKDYDILYNKLDSQRVYLGGVLTEQDYYYREILELDSISATMRLAGVGGSTPIGSISLGSIENQNINGMPINKEIQSLYSQLKLQDRSYNEIFVKALEREDKLNKIPAISPILMQYNTWISSYFGGRIDPFTHTVRIHHGLDFVASKNTKIYATGDGTVTLAKYSRNGYGNEVVISHGYGYSTRYAHLNKILVKEGEKIKRGQTIGTMGNTGRSTGTHLHYEIRQNGIPINPIYYFSENLTPSEYKEMIERLNEN